MPDPPIIPLSPLSLVVFPGEKQPLHIFEERYKAMIADCQASADSSFGISLLQDGALSNVGCNVELMQILHEHPDGRLDILTRGRQRYRALEAYQDRPYLRAAVEFFDDCEELVHPGLFEEAVERWQQLLALLGERREAGERAEMPADSFGLAQRVGLDLSVKQKLLEMASENQRLKELIEYFDQVLQYHQESVKRTRSNGHPKEL
jgi:Lon protease-like protein